MDFKNIYYISHQNFNEKSHDLPNIYFKKYFNKLEINNLKTLINFIEKNNYENNILLYYNQGNKEKKILMIELIKYLRIIKKEIKIKIILFIFDFWQTGEKYNNIINKEINNINNFYVLSFTDIEKLNFFNNYNFEKNNKYIINFKVWSCYNSSFVSFNNRPINKVFLSGAINKNNYPERYFIEKFNNVIKYKYNQNDIKINNNNYNLELNKYLVCFYSNVYVLKNNNDKKYYNTKLLLLKFFEILASGSLLLCSNEEIDLLEEYNLENKKHYYAINLKNNNIEIQKEIDYILDEKNRKIIDELRLNGYNFAKKYLNSELKFKELLKIINTL